MKIGPDGVRPVEPDRIEPTEPTPAEKVEGAEPTGAPQEADRVVLSERAQEVQLAREALAKLPPVRQEQVDALRRAVQDGVYEVDGEELAEDMLKEGGMQAP